MNKNKQGFAPIVIILIIAGVLVVAGGVYYYKIALKQTPKTIACSTDAKICPDGTAVGRVAPTCEFTPCPPQATTTQEQTVQDETLNWKTYRNEKYGFEFRYPVGLFLRETENDRSTDSIISVKITKDNRENVVITKKGEVVIMLNNTSDAGCKIDSNTFLSQKSNFYQKDKELVINGYKTVIFRRGCYECYTGDPRLGTDGIVAFILNNKGSAYLTLKSEGKTQEYQEVYQFFLTEFLPTFKIDSTKFESIECKPASG